jgi:hypothetical protein
MSLVSSVASKKHAIANGYVVSYFYQVIAHIVQIAPHTDKDIFADYETAQAV